jgi:hypothetical protein
MTREERCRHFDFPARCHECLTIRAERAEARVAELERERDRLLTDVAKLSDDFNTAWNQRCER